MCECGHDGIGSFPPFCCFLVNTVRVRGHSWTNDIPAVVLQEMEHSSGHIAGRQLSMNLQLMLLESLAFAVTH